MPYRARGRVVQVLKDGEWRPFKVHPTPAQAKAQAAALNIKLKNKKENAKPS